MRRYTSAAPIAATDHAEPISGINTTPLIDVMLVLLIMFIITIPATTNQIPMDLPQPGPVAPDLQVPHLLAIARDGTVAIDGAPVAGGALAARFAAIRADPRAELQVSTDPAARYQAFANTLAVVKRAGISRLGFLGKQPTRF